jgi:hypothetical protein
MPLHVAHLGDERVPVIVLAFRSLELHAGDVGTIASAAGGRCSWLSPWRRGGAGRSQTRRVVATSALVGASYA